MARGKKKSKKRTHKVMQPDASIPRSFVIKSGLDTSPLVNQLVRDVRQVLEPNTATKLKERKKNKIKDFLMVAGQLMVSHLLAFSKSSNGGLNLRIGKIPRGPTLTFHVHQYSLVKDVLALQSRPKSPGNEFHCSPLVVLNNFGSKERHIQLIATVLQNMFPPIKVTKMRLSDAKRVVLFNLNPETNLIEMRHYRITIKTLGISKSVKAIIQTNVPDLRKFDDISDFIMKASFASESDVEDAAEASVTLPKQSDQSAEKRAIKLFELGPRLDLKLIKIQEGLCGGEVIHHEFVQKTQDEVSNLKAKKQAEKEIKDQRRAEQENNVQAKAMKAIKSEEDVQFEEEEFDDLMNVEDEEEDDDEEDGNEDEDIEEYEEELA